MPTPRLSVDDCSALFENSMDAILLTMPDGRIIAANPAACVMFGMTEAELCGAGRDRLIDTTDPKFSEYLKERHRVGKARGELVFRRKDGSAFVGEASSVIIEDGNSAFVIIHDITDRKAAEKARHASEERLRQAINIDTVGVLFFSLDGRLKDANHTFERMSGYTRQELARMEDWMALTVPEFVGVTEETAANLAARGTTDPYEKQMIRKDGSRWWGLFAPTRLSGSGRESQCVEFIIDITKQKQVEAALKESEERYRNLFHNNQAVMLLIEPLTGRIVDANSAACTYYGYTLDEITALKVTDINTLPDEEVQVKMQRAKSEQEGHFTFQHRLADGQIRDVEVFAGPLAIGPHELIYSIVHDITERKRGEEALRASEAKFRAVFEQAEVGMGRVSFEDARWVDVNEAFCRMLGYSAEELRSMPWPRMTHPEDVNLDLISFHRMAAGELESYTVEKRFIHKSGHYVWARLTLSLVRNAHGRPDYEIAVIENITERKEAEEALQNAKTAAEEANRAKSDYLAKMSHELRTPMTVIVGALEQLAETVGTPEQRSLIDLGETAAQRLLSIINDVLDISKIEAREVKIEPRPFKLLECVRQAVELFALTAMEKGVHLKWKAAPQIPIQVQGDPDRLSQILVNIVGNAIKFTDQGEVTVDLSEGTNGIVFTIRDTGIGIPAEMIGGIFEPFNQGDKSRTRHYGGTGLGLTITRELIELMGGSIEAESEPGEGSTFTVTVPLPPVPSAEERLPSKEFNVLAGPPSRILVVEDEPAVRMMVETILRRHGWDVALAENGREAIDKWQGGKFDVILMDLKMPVMDGFTAVREIRSREGENKKKVCIIALTAHARKETQEECLAAGMNGFLTKPMHVKDLKTTIDKCLH